MSSRADSELVGDLREAIRLIFSYLGGMSYAEFCKDTKTRDAVIRNIEIVGEAAKGISEKLRAENPNIPWKGMAGIRDRLIHHYFGVNLEIVWQVVSEELPKLEPELARIAAENNSKENNAKAGCG
jgi:uncharacterized protein with HEPN domain